MLSLLSAPVGQMLEIKWITCNQVISDFLDRCGLKQGESVRVVSSAGGSVIVAVDDIRIAIGRDIAERIKI
ncbi:MAG: FeoA family protein [Lachnospiraceae bacterium]|nr:FeoA family protein [Lachnospiraceae bacterium]